MDPSFKARLEYLGDLELALLISFIAEEHSIFSTETSNTGSLLEELRLSCIHTFNLQPAVVICSADTTVDDFNQAILVDLPDLADIEARRLGDNLRPDFSTYSSTYSARTAGRSESLHHDLEQRRIADVIIAQGLDRAPADVQIQALELIRSGRIFTRSSMQVAPKGLLFATILSDPHARLSHHLQDLFCMSHFHAEDDMLPHIENSDARLAMCTFSPKEIELLRKQMAEITITAEMAQYMHNIAVFLRKSRYLKGGVTAAATRHFRTLTRALTPLHSLDYITPSIVALAARKVYPHRLILATAENERTLLWGSDTNAVRNVLRHITPEIVIEEVLNSIEAPL